MMDFKIARAPGARATGARGEDRLVRPAQMDQHKEDEGDGHPIDGTFSLEHT
jgi:hypothetical protein